MESDDVTAVLPANRRQGASLSTTVEVRGIERHDSLDLRLRFEQLIGDLLARVVTSADDDVEQAIKSSLASLGEFLSVDRITLSETDSETFRVLSSWAAPGIEPIPQTFRVPDIPWYAAKLRRGEIVRVARIADLPHEASHEKQMMRRMGTKSHLAIPLSNDMGIVGAIALGALREHRAWSDELVNRLRLVGQIFATALGRKRSNERLARQQQELAHVGRVAAVGELAAILAHDLNQPLTAILANAQATRRFVAQGHADPVEVDDALADIAADANRASAIIGRLRTLLRKGEPSLTPIDLHSLIMELEPIVAGELKAYEVALRLELAEGLPTTKADAVQIQQVLLNLLSNACHAMASTSPDQRELVIRTAPGNVDLNVIRLEICDSGPAVPAQVFQRIFEPFFTTKPSGLGMGLTISRSIIEAHHGRIWATQNPVRGITVNVVLPACEKL